MLALLQTLVEELDRKAVLAWQQKVIDILPNNFDVSLTRKVTGQDWETKEDKFEPRIVITRNSKELFDLSVSRADNNFIDEVTVHGACMRKGDYIRLSASKLATELPFFVKVFDMHRKLSNLYSTGKVQICMPERGKPGVELEVVVNGKCVIASLDRDLEAKVVKAPASSFSLNKGTVVGTTKKGEDAIFALIEKGLK